MRILGLCGSLRQRSLSSALLQAFRHRTPVGIGVDLFDRHGVLPLFSPDAEAAPPPDVRALWSAVEDCRALLIVSPEYAHGITAVMKNQLDWLVGQVAVVGKPAAVVNPAYGSHHADAALREVLRTMSVRIVEPASVRIPVIGSGVGADPAAVAERFADEIDAVFDALSQDALRA